MSTERPGLTPDGRYWLSKRPGSDSWHRTWFDPVERQTRRVSLGTTDFRAAHEALAVWWTENRRLKDERPESVTLDEVLVRYYRDHAVNLPSKDQARIACAKLSAHSGALAVSEFGQTRQREFIKAMRDDGYSDGYIRRTLSVGQAALNWAHAEGLIRAVPVVKLIADGQHRERVLSVAEVKALIEAAREDHLYRFVVLELATWGRPEAVLELTRERCDTERHLIDLNPEGRKQTKKYRPVVPMVEAARHVIEDVKAGELIRWRGEPVSSVKTAWRRLRTRAGLDTGVIRCNERSMPYTRLRCSCVAVNKREAGMDYMALLEHSFQQEKGDSEGVRSRLEFLAEFIFDFTTYDSEMAELFAAKAVEVCAAISHKATFEYIEDADQYRWFLLMCNMPFFAKRLEWGTSIRGAWWWHDQPSIVSTGIWSGDEQVLELKFARDEWSAFTSALEAFAEHDRQVAVA